MKKFENVYPDAALMKKVLLGEADEAEQREFDKRLSECPELQKVYGQLQDGATLDAAFEEYRRYSSTEAYRSFLRSIGRTETHGRRHRSLRLAWWHAVAAVAVLAVALSFYVLNNVFAGKEETVLIQPGTQQAQLTLPDGSVIDVAKKDVSVTVDGVQVKYKEGVLSYQPADTLPSAGQDEETTPARSNELLIPRGGENTVILSDGTMVHLNAGSKLTYPVRFSGKRRMVALEGEGYFRVKENREHPFVVRTHWGEIIVHGTEFNVNAYDDTGICRTTLVKGKVSCVVPSQEPVMLLPGEQAVLAKNGITKQAVDVEEHVGWMKGMYVFNNRPLEEIMQTFERWYNVRIYYENPSLRQLTYSGNLKRYNTINTFLNALKITGDIDYKINGRNILIYENK